jgi:chemotaxis methyl-accepting protein methylase
MDEEPDLTELSEKIRLDRGFEGRHYKEKCLRRRIAVRMRARGRTTFEEYARLLDEDPAEYDLLLDALTINVTKFFRNAEVWAAFEDKVIPALFGLSRGERRIWTAGCASGEEPYTISMLLHEWAERNGRESELRRFRILGTDIDRRSLAIARAAEYGELSMTETPDAARARWFSPGPPFRLDPRITSLVSFESRDLIASPPPEGGQHLIVCRNVIIYLDRPIQEELFQRFYDALLPGGFLVLGKVETLLGRTRALFRPVNNRERIFMKPTE